MINDEVEPQDYLTPAEIRREERLATAQMIWLTCINDKLNPPAVWLADSLCNISRAAERDIWQLVKDEKAKELGQVIIETLEDYLIAHVKRHE